MTDREKVINAFDKAKEPVWFDDDEYTVGYNNGIEAGKNIALTLFKKQEPILLENQHKPYGFNTNPNSPWISRCPRCGKKVEGKQTRFCKYCGQKVKWE